MSVIDNESRAGSTSTCIDSLTPSKLAVTEMIPTEMAVNKPVFDTPSVAVSVTDQVTSDVKSRVELSEYVPITLS